jgi:hypothetical protein
MTSMTPPEAQVVAVVDIMGPYPVAAETVLEIMV